MSKILTDICGEIQQATDNGYDPAYDDLPF